MMLDYEEMLDEAYSQMPPQVFRHERFEVPRLKSAIIGRRRGPTVVYNLNEICETLNRDPLSVLRFLSKELATAGTMEGTRAIFQGKFERATLERLINRYVDRFVMCPVCKRPDSKIVKEKRLYFLVCEACGARSPVRPI